MSSGPINKAAWLDAVGSPLRVGDMNMPSPGPDELVLRNRAVAINPIDPLQQEKGFLIKSFPWVLGSDVAGTVHAVGSNVGHKFKLGDRVVGHPWGFLTKKPEDQAFTLYPRFKEAAVLPLAIDTAAAGLFQAAPYLELTYPSLEPKPTGKAIVVYGGSSSVGAMAIQLAVAAGVRVVAIASPHNFDFVRSNRASEVFDNKSSTLVEDVVGAIGDKTSFAGIYDAISLPPTYEHDYAIIKAVGHGRVAITHEVPPNVPEGVLAAYVLGIGEFAFPIWEEFLGPALASGKLRCAPKPLVVGKGLESLDAAFKKLQAGVSAQKIVVEL